ncbi:MAG: hypothetical protein IIB39_05305 [Candidatus Marinimicrobia bacterium]|nr:hypothetical protein [Candidatus Neomarinimicrobiota bacterium]
MLKKSSLTFILIFLIVGSLSGETDISNLSAYPKDNGIVLEWDSGIELELEGYEIQRSTSGGTFIVLTTIKALGSNSSYTYFDESVFSKSTVRTYSYRLKILDSDGSFSYSKLVSVTPTLSAARETWGSIKALFR